MIQNSMVVIYEVVTELVVFFENYINNIIKMVKVIIKNISKVMD